MIKRFTVNLLIIFMIFLGVIYGYTQSFSLSKFDRFSYAEADNWSSCDSSDLVTAFRYYCKSRNLAIKGSAADALTTFTTTTFNNICSTLGIDPTSLQAELKKTTKGNLGLRFLFSNTGITAYNRIFAEFLQNNDLEVGDEVDDKVLETSKYFTSPDGYSCKVFVVNAITTNNKSVQKYGGSAHPYDIKGSPFYYSYGYVLGLTQNVSSPSIRLTENLSTVISIVYKTGNPIVKEMHISNNGNYLSIYSNYSGTLRYCGYPCIILGGNNKLYLGAFAERYNNFDYETIKSLLEITNGTATDEDVYVTTNNTTINNNTYNSNYTIIYNEGDTYISDGDDEPLPTTPPGGGGGDPGGGGGDNPGGDPDPTPSGPDVPDWHPPSGTGTIGSDGTFDFDLPFSLPNLNIDWSLKDIGHKFPFCIPGDIVSFYQTLSVEPRAPSIDAHIPLGNFYDWHFVADFSQYDRWAVIIRAVEYVGFVIGLIYFTVRMVKG